MLSPMRTLGMRESRSLIGDHREFGNVIVSFSCSNKQPPIPNGLKDKYSVDQVNKYDGYNRHSNSKYLKIKSAILF